MTIRIDGIDHGIWITDVQKISVSTASAKIAGLPGFLKPRPFRPKLLYQVRLFMEWWSLTYTIDQLLKLNDLGAIDTTRKILYTKSGRPISADISLARLSEEEVKRVQHERLIQALNKNSVVLGTKQPDSLSQQPAERQQPEITAAILWHVREKIENQLDGRLNARPSYSDFFIRNCRDKLSYEQMNKRYGWKKRTLVNRKRKLDAFLRKECNSSLDDFLMADRSIFREAEKQMDDYRAKRINPYHVAGESEDAEE